MTAVRWRCDAIEQATHRGNERTKQTGGQGPVKDAEAVLEVHCSAAIEMVRVQNPAPLAKAKPAARILRGGGRASCQGSLRPLSPSIPPRMP